MLLGTPHETEYKGIEAIKPFVTKTSNLDQIEDFRRNVTVEEIVDVFKSIKANKAPGPDGYSAGFYKKAWEKDAQMKKGESKKSASYSIYLLPQALFSLNKK